MVGTTGSDPPSLKLWRTNVRSASFFMVKARLPGRPAGWPPCGRLAERRGCRVAALLAMTARMTAHRRPPFFMVIVEPRFSLCVLCALCGKQAVPP
jgi:hypothetical protein